MNLLRFHLNRRSGRPQKRCQNHGPAAVSRLERGAQPAARTTLIQKHSIGPPRSAGFSLLEVILSIVILAGGLAVLGELVRVGTRSSRSARDLTTGQLLCESMMAELDAGIAIPTATEGIIDHYDGSQWAYSVTVDPIDQEGLLEVVITVQQEMSAVSQPVTCRLARWMIDPQLITELAAIDEELAATQTAPSASETGSSNTDASASAGAAAAPDNGGGR